MSEDTFRVAVTAIIHRADGRMLITRRTPEKKRWPGKWTVPGGGVTTADFMDRPPDTDGNQWYHVLERAVRREVHEETGIRIGQVDYLCNLFIPDTVIISFTTKTVDLDPVVTLQKEECDRYAWVFPEEAK